jgi:hypothetical protein
MLQPMIARVRRVADGRSVFGWEKDIADERTG